MNAISIVVRQIILNQRHEGFSLALLVTAEFTQGHTACHQLAVCGPLKLDVFSAEMISLFESCSVWHFVLRVKSSRRNPCCVFSSLQCFISLKKITVAPAYSTLTSSELFTVMICLVHLIDKNQQTCIHIFPV